MNPQGNPQRSQRLRLVLVLGIFLAPVLLAWLLYQSGGDWFRGGTSNHGELVTPARPLAPFTFRDNAGGEVNLGFFEQHWTLVYFGAATCEQACEASLYAMRQVRLALGKDMDRVQRLMVLPAGADLKQIGAVLAAYEGTRVVLGGTAELADFMAQFALPGQAPATAHRLYLIDPLGNLMMSYPAGADPSGILKDLQRLLRLSNIG